MGILDSVIGSVSGKSSDNNEGILDSIGGLLGSQSGGLQGLIENFTKKGLGDSIGSWIGTGKNLPISAEQIQSVLGNEHVAAIAKKIGISTEDASTGLANLLPGVIDKLTPDGKVPDASALSKGLGNLLQGFGK